MSSHTWSVKVLLWVLSTVVAFASFDALASGLQPSSTITQPVNGSALPAALGSYSIKGSATDLSGTGLSKVEVSFDGGGTWRRATDTSGSGSLTSWVYNWSPLPLGSYSIISKATDNTNGSESPAPGVHVVVDGSAPTSSITSPAPGACVAGASIAITGTAADTGGSGLARVEVSTNGGATWTTASGTASWSYTWTLPADGSYTIKSRAVDMATNVESPGAGRTVIVDNTPPTVAVISPIAGAIISDASCIVSGTASDGAGSGISRVEVSTDGGGTWTQATGTTSWSYAWTTPSDGPYTIKTRSKDNAGNTSNPVAGTAVTVDKTPPVSAVTAPAAGLVTNSPSLTITGTANDGAGSGVSKVEVSTDGGSTWAQATGAASWSYAWAPSPDGPCIIKSRATDLAGHVETPGAGVGITVDRTPPTSFVTSPAAGAALKGTSVTITGTSSDGAGTGVSKVEVSTDGGSTWAQAVGTASWSYDWTLPADGHYTIRCRATDMATNVETPGTGVAVMVDKTPPVSSISSPLPGAFISSVTYTITGVANDGSGSGVSGVEVSTDGGTSWAAASGTASWSYTWTTPATGSYTIKTRATDLAANVETPGAGASVIVDKIPPSSVVTSPAQGALIGAATTYNITGTASDTGGSGLDRVEVSTDGGATWSPVSGTASWSYNWTLPTDGSYTIKTRSYDRAGNTETPGVGVSVTVDNTPPIGSIAPKNGKYTRSKKVWFTLSARDVGSNCPQPDPVMCNVPWMQFSTDGLTWTAWEAASTQKQWDFGNVAEGVKVLDVRYKDPAGNVSLVYSNSVIYDITPPTSAITDPANGSFVGGGTTYVITGTAFDAVAGVKLVEVSTDGGSTWAPATDTAGGAWTSWSYTWILPAEAGYTLKTRATDNADNVETPGAGITVTVDKTPPTAGSVKINADAAYTASTAVSLSLSATDARSGVAMMRISNDGVFDTEPWEAYATSKAWSISGPDGAKTVYVQFKDGAGNVSAAFTGTVTLDTTAPAGTVIINGGATFTNSASVALALSATDAGSGVTQMQISNDGVFDTEPWETYAASKTWPLSSGDGPKTVYVRFKDGAGNVSAAFTGTVTLDTTAPAGTMIINGGATFTNSASVSLAISATDAGSGVTQMQISNDGVFDTEPWETYAASRIWSLEPPDGQKTVYVRFRDSAGNVSGPSSSVITLSTDATPPVVAISTPATGAVLTAASCTVTGTADDGAGTGVKTVEVSTDGGATWSLASVTTQSWSYAWNIPAAGTYGILCRATDNAGNSAVTPVSTVTAKATVSADRASVVINYNLARPPATTKVKLRSQPLSLNGSVSSTKSWLGMSAQAGSNTPSGVLITVNPSGLIARNYTGTVTFSSAYATNGTVTIPVSLTVSPASALSPEQTHFNWSQAITGGNCNFCHLTSGTFLPAGMDARISPSLCKSCHNETSVAHGRSAGGSLHAIFVCASSGGGKWPSYGNITAALNNNQPFAKLKSGRLVICTTCHNPMGKKEDYGRKWEFTSTTDRFTYYLSDGGWANYGSMSPMVYRTTNVMSEPTYSRDKKRYLVSPSEYKYDEEAGSITFAAQQAATSYIYATLDYQYLRASSEANRLCQDCHTQATHKNANCLTCHEAHGAVNLADIRSRVRTNNLTTISVKFLGYTGINSFTGGGPDHNGICEVCHTRTKYYRWDGSGFANHSGGVNYDRTNCTTCHSHSAGFAR